MAGYLVYWRTFWDEIDDPRDVLCDWHTNDDMLVDHIEPDDLVWVVIQGDLEHSEQWRLLERLVVNEPATQLVARDDFRYRIIGDEERSVLFDPIEQDDFANVLAQLEFASGNRIPKTGRDIGMSLQKYRRLAPSDIDLLREYEQALPTLERK